jgi:hypothetical protein
MEQRPIIFLDVDGVLHPFTPDIRETDLFNSACISILKKIVDESNSEIVLSSSWRNFDSMRLRLSSVLARHGLSFSRWILCDAFGSETKIQNIIQFIVNNKIDSNFVILDDEDLPFLSLVSNSMFFKLAESRFYRTDCLKGLTQNDLKPILDILFDNGSDD